MKAIFTIIILLSSLSNFAQDTDDIDGVNMTVIHECNMQKIYVEINDKKITFIDIKTGYVMKSIVKKGAKRNHNIAGIKMIVINKRLELNTCK